MADIHHTRSREEHTDYLSMDSAEHQDIFWIFGYGSILWKTGFEYTSCKTGYIEGFIRRFYQGSTSHRGTPSNPGRVATLVPEEDGITWGVAYELRGRKMIHDALDHLGMRECALGGYISMLVPFTERGQNSSKFNAFVFTATEENPLFLGATDTMEELADQIAECKGPCGHNIEYVMKLAEYIHTSIPEDTDTHLTDIVRLLRSKLGPEGIERRINAAKSTTISTSRFCLRCNSLCSETAYCDKCRDEACENKNIDHLFNHQCHLPIVSSGDQDS